MMKSETAKQLKISGMVCSGCEINIEKKVGSIPGVKKVKASYKNGTANIIYDESKVKLQEIKRQIEEMEYQVTGVGFDQKEYEKINYSQLFLILVILVGAFLIIDRLGGFTLFNFFPEAKQGMGYATLFVIGLLTSVHCIGMCGGINLSQCINATGDRKLERLRPSFLYNLGRVISYTVIGGIVGGLGSVISFNGIMRGAVAIFAGIFMIIMGLNMLHIFPWLRKFSLRMPKFLFKNMRGKSNSPLYVGILNGLMPCGPLQAMQLFALSTEDPVKGALSMMAFSIGTVPLMFTFGALSSIISKKLTAKFMMFSAVLVMILGLGMLNTGISMSGFVALGTNTSQTENFVPVIEDGYQIVTVEVSSRSYEPITVQSGIPVKVNFYVEEGVLNGCNNAIMIPEYEIQLPLEVGDNIIEFTPDKTGVIPYSCWMNMIRSTITVVE